MSSEFDYSSLLSTADSLIARFGRDILLTRASRAPQNAWSSDQNDGVNQAPQSVSVKGLPTTLDKATIELQTIERPLARWVFQALTAIPEEVGPEWRLVDGSRDYQMVSVKPVQPGDTLLVYFAVVEI